MANFDPVRLIQNMSKEEVKALLRKVMGPSKRTLEGQEKENMLLVFKLIEPVESTNNQRSFTDGYIHAGKMYDVHYFDDEIVVEELLKDDI